MMHFEYRLALKVLGTECTKDANMIITLTMMITVVLFIIISGYESSGGGDGDPMIVILVYNSSAQMKPAHATQHTHDQIKH